MCLEEQPDDKRNCNVVKLLTMVVSTKRNLDPPVIRDRNCVDKSSCVHLRRKGRKERAIPLRRSNELT
jgi:hypothetical protein